MGLAERDYSRRASGSSGLAAAMEWSATTWLIAIFVVVFFLDALLTPPWPTMFMSSPGEIDSSERAIAMSLLSPIVRWTHFSYGAAIEDRQLWRIVTFPIAHTNVWALAINVLCLWAFARPMEWQLGSRRLLALFAVCTAASALTYVGLILLHLRMADGWFPLAGATGGVLGVLVAAAYAGPDEDMVLWTSGLIVPRRTLAWIVAAIITIVTIKQEPGGAGISHLGGAVAGLLVLPLVRHGRVSHVP